MPREIVTDYYKAVEDRASLKNLKVSAFAWGKPGTGKTEFFGTFPKPFVLDTDGGLLTLAGKDVKSFTVTSDMDVYQTFMNIIQDAKFQKGPFAPGKELADRETFVIDSLSQLSALLFEGIMEENKKDTRAAYQLLLKRMTTLTSLFKELTRYGFHVVGTSGEAAKENSLTGVMEPVPNIAGSFRDFVGHLFDCSLWFEVVTRNGKPTYNVYSVAEKGRAAKVRVDIPGKVENMTFDIIMKALDKKFQ